MRHVFFEATNGINWGKFMVGIFDADDAAVRSTIDDRPLIASRGWALRSHVQVFDLQTGEGAFFHLGGYAQADLNKKQIWVCPLFEPFLQWLYDHPDALVDETEGPVLVELPESIPMLQGYRREGEGLRLEYCLEHEIVLDDRPGRGHKPQERWGCDVVTLREAW